MKQKTISLEHVYENPWYFRLLNEHDMKSLLECIDKYGASFIPNPVIAIIDKKHYVVDGHARIAAFRKLGIKKITFNLAEHISDFVQLRVWAFKLNRHSSSNPFSLADMFQEDLKVFDDLSLIAENYNVKPEYVESVLKINSLADDAKILAQKIIKNSNKKFQFINSQITPYHFSYLSTLNPKKQIKVLEWIFHDIIFGPPNESLVSIPSIYEIVNEIDKLENTVNVSKNDLPTKTKKSDSREVPFTCICGKHFDINIKSKKIFECIEKENVIIKKEFLHQDSKPFVFSSLEYSKSRLKELIDESKESEIRLSIINDSKTN